MTFPLFAVGVSTSRLSEIRDLGFTAARSFEVAVSPEEFVSECRENGLDAMSRTNGAVWWTVQPDEPKFNGSEGTRIETVRLILDSREVRLLTARNAIPVCYVPGHYKEILVDMVRACGTEVMLGSYGRRNGYPPQFTLWRPSCLTGELKCVALNCEHGNAEWFRWDLFTTLASGAKSIAIYRPHAIVSGSRKVIYVWEEFHTFVTANDRLLRSGTRTVQFVGSELYPEYQIKNKDGTVVCTVPPQPRDQTVTWRLGYEWLGYEWCSIRVSGDYIETKSWRGMA